VQRKDEAIKTDIVALLFWDGRVDAADIHVDTLEGLVTLSGRISQTGPRCFPGPRSRTSGRVQCANLPPHPRPPGPRRRACRRSSLLGIRHGGGPGVGRGGEDHPGRVGGGAALADGHRAVRKQAIRRINRKADLCDEEPARPYGRRSSSNWNGKIAFIKLKCVFLGEGRLASPATAAVCRNNRCPMRPNYAIFSGE
jgi:hypothetical protein